MTEYQTVSDTTQKPKYIDKIDLLIELLKTYDWNTAVKIVKATS